MHFLFQPYGHENKGMDDRYADSNYHKKDRHHDRDRHHHDYENRKGHQNYGMDEDFESRDGSPSAHPGDGPMGTGV